MNREQQPDSPEAPRKPVLYSCLPENAPVQQVSRVEIESLLLFVESHELEFAGGDLVEHVNRDESGAPRQRRSDTYYHDLIFALIQIRLPEEEARRDWRAILRNKQEMSGKLDRNVGIHVAALDYYTNIKRMLSNPTIVDARNYADTASRAITDELTGAYNRRFFNTELERLFSAAPLDVTQFSLIMIDLDNFKIYNDTNGHIKGDIALIETVRVFNAVCGSEAAVCRYGGEEFVIILPACPLSEAVWVAENVRRAVYDFRFFNEHVLPGNRLSISLGVSSWRPDMNKAVEVLEEADIALYRAKKAGRNQVKVFLKDDAASGEAADDSKGEDDAHARC